MSQNAVLSPNKSVMSQEERNQRTKPANHTAKGGKLRRSWQNDQTAEEDVFIYNQMGAKGIEDMIKMQHSNIE